MFGFLQPYENLYCNVLECLLSLDVLVLLLMRNTEQISDELQVLPQQTSNMTTVGTCRRAVEGITGFSWLLFLLYYFPPVVFLVAAVPPTGGGNWGSLPQAPIVRGPPNSAGLVQDIIDS